MQISVILLILLYMSLSILSEASGEIKSFEVYLGFIINTVIWIILFIGEINKRAYSFVLMHWLFSIFFLGFAPTIQYAVGWFPWIRTRSDNVIIRANLLLLVWTIAFQLGVNLAQKFNKRVLRKARHRPVIDSQNQFRIENYLQLIPFLTVLNVLFTFYRLVSIGFPNILSRGTNTGVSLSESGTVSMIITNFMQGLIFFTGALSIVNIKKHRSVESYIYLVVNMLFILVGYFPTSMARYAAGVIYLGLFIVCFKKLRANRLFILVFVMVFTIVPPILNAFRIVSFSEVSLVSVVEEVFSKSVKVWVAYDYDAYTQFTMCLEYTDKYGFEGNHILTVLLFFVPRSIWESKALSGSYIIAHKQGTFDNVSFPLPAISYMDGGVALMIIFAICVGFLMRYTDNYYWANSNHRVYNYLDVLYPPLVVFVFFLCRGDLHYIYPYFACYLLASMCILLMSRAKIRK